MNESLSPRRSCVRSHRRRVLFSPTRRWDRRRPSFCSVPTHWHRCARSRCPYKTQRRAGPRSPPIFRVPPSRPRRDTPCPPGHRRRPAPGIPRTGCRRSSPGPDADGGRVPRAARAAGRRPGGCTASRAIGRSPRPAIPRCPPAAPPRRRPVRLSGRHTDPTVVSVSAWCRWGSSFFCSFWTLRLLLLRSRRTTASTVLFC
mmetsp:Transcript_8811/g.18083  ORF Transcript_8811/g.18083 Transcript_8811/m.18083 type:complete len:201 (-) Transcript_8811:183-785(-)